MIPAEHHDGPGLSSMGMQTIPRYAKEAGAGSAAPGISIDPSASQALGLRTVLVRRGALASSMTATGTIDFNQRDIRSEEHTSELQSLMRISYAVFCLKKKTHLLS